MGKTTKPKANKQKVVTSLSNIPLPDAVTAPQEKDTVEEQEEAMSDAEEEEPSQQAEAEVVEDRVPPQFRGATPGGRRMTREEAMAFFQQCGMGVFIPAAQQPPIQIQYVSPVQPAAPNPPCNPMIPLLSTSPFFRCVMNAAPCGDETDLSFPEVPFPPLFRHAKKSKKKTKKEEDEFFSDSFFWNPGPEWDTIGLVAGGATVLGLGALLYHFLKK